MNEKTNSTANGKSGAYVMDGASIPKEVRDTVAERVGGQGEIYPAKEGGSYRGPVVHVDDKFIVQAVGKEQKNAVVHRREDVTIQSANLQVREANGDLDKRNIQVHYTGDKAKAYPWNPEQDKANREARTAAKTPSPEELLKAAQNFAQTEIKNTKQRDAFVKNFEVVVSSVQVAQRLPEAKAPTPAKEATKQADHGLER